MRFVALAAVVAIGSMILGCGGGGTDQTAGPLSAEVQLTPSGTGDFVLVGTTGIFFRTSPGAVDTPTLLRISRFPSPVGLVAPVPEGFGFVAAASLEPVSAPSETVTAGPVILRVPPVRPLPEGTKLLIMEASTGDRVPVFEPLADSAGRPVLGTVLHGGSVEFAAPRTGAFMAVTGE